MALPVACCATSKKRKWRVSVLGRRCASAGKQIFKQKEGVCPVLAEAGVLMCCCWTSAGVLLEWCSGARTHTQTYVHTCMHPYMHAWTHNCTSMFICTHMHAWASPVFRVACNALPLAPSFLVPKQLDLDVCSWWFNPSPWCTLDVLCQMYDSRLQDRHSCVPPCIRPRALEISWHQSNVWPSKRTYRGLQECAGHKQVRAQSKVSLELCHVHVFVRAPKWVQAGAARSDNLISTL
eukprot:1143372-Pelagomonas_calceolata.AAC.4